jgi:hypothetical protein
MSVTVPTHYLVLVHSCRLNHLQKKSTLRLAQPNPSTAEEGPVKRDLLGDLPSPTYLRPPKRGLRAGRLKSPLPRLSENGSIRKIGMARGATAGQRTPRVEPRYSRPNGLMMTFLFLLEAMVPARKADSPREWAMDRSFATSFSGT